MGRLLLMACSLPVACLLLVSGCVSITQIHVADSDDVRTRLGWPGTRIIVDGGSMGAVIDHQAVGPTFLAWDGGSMGAVIDHQAVGPTFLAWDGGFASSLLVSRTLLTTAPRQNCLALITGPLNPLWVPPRGMCTPSTFY
jgi:hypothetical protein